MDIVPIIAAFVFSPFDGFSLMAKEEDKTNLYHYSEFNVGDHLELHCIDGSGNNVYMSSAYIDGENFNKDFPRSPIRRAVFRDILNSPPESCIINTLARYNFIPANELDPCTERYTASFFSKFSFVVIKDGNRLNLWSAKDEEYFFSTDLSTNDLKVSARAVNINPRKVRTLESFYLDGGILKVYSGGQRSSYNNMPCFWDDDDINNYRPKYTISSGQIFSALEFLGLPNVGNMIVTGLIGGRSHYAPRDSDVFLDIDYSYDFLGIDIKYWKKVEALLPDIIENMN